MMRPHDHKPDHTTTHFYSRTGWVPYVGYGPRNLHTLEGCHAHTSTETTRSRNRQPLPQLLWARCVG